jgi:hypothetical protein
MRSQIEKAMALIRQGQSRKALLLLERVALQLPSEPTPDLYGDDVEEDTLELDVPSTIPTATIVQTKRGPQLQIDAEGQWHIGTAEVEELKALCSTMEQLQALEPRDFNTYLLAIKTKLREWVSVGRVKPK